MSDNRLRPMLSSHCSRQSTTSYYERALGCSSLYYSPIAYIHNPGVSLFTLFVTQYIKEIEYQALLTLLGLCSGQDGCA